ncbi:TBC1 domain family member 5-like [Convolutriloba macropyga]|uniref:TBC1 domain family member 5-like n=1 Tax=Convolutriloba macropyga TaxID=536237 RepID=UPI003F5290FD
MLSGPKIWVSQSSLDLDEIPPEPITGLDKTGFRAAWTGVFHGSSKTSLANVRKLALAGDVADLPFRSVIWKLLLGILPPNPKLWMHESSLQRDRYERLKEKYQVDFCIRGTDHDIVSRHGVSQQPGLYSNDDLKRDIYQDVVRTFPDIEYFSDPKIICMMCSILYTYAKENADVMYKQGMHELLAIIVFVLDNDNLSFKKCVKARTKMSERVHAVLRGSHIEHDAFILFSKVMQHTKVWYEYKDSTFHQFKSKLQFSYSSNSGHELQSPAIKKINALWSKYVKIMDPELHHKMEMLDIQPHVFSIRWLRLIFARELEFDSVLSLWDAIFAYDTELSFVDSVYCAVLFSIRNEIVDGDHSSCLQALMRHPKELSTIKIVNWAMYLANPSDSPRPLDFTDRSHWVHPQITKVALSNKSLGLKGSGRSYSLTNLISSVLKSGVGTEGGSSVPKEGTEGKSDWSSLKSKKKENNVLSSSPRRQSVVVPSVTAVDSKYAYQSHNQSTLLPSAKASNSILVENVDELARKCNYCSERLQVFIQSLGEVLQEEDLKSDEKILVSIAGLKQIRDVLNGSIKVPTNELGGVKPNYDNRLSSVNNRTHVNDSSQAYEMMRWHIDTQISQKLLSNDASGRTGELRGECDEEINRDNRADWSRVERAPVVISSQTVHNKIGGSSPQGKRKKLSSKPRSQVINLNIASKKLLLPDKSLSGNFSPTSLECSSGSLQSSSSQLVLSGQSHAPSPPPHNSSSSKSLLDKQESLSPISSQNSLLLSSPHLPPGGAIAAPAKDSSLEEIIWLTSSSEGGPVATGGRDPNAVENNQSEQAPAAGTESSNSAILISASNGGSRIH